MTKCNACGGVYDTAQPDGTSYFHRCPPLSHSELDAAVKAGKVQLPAGETVDDAILRRTYERGNMRDENLVATSGPGAQQIKAAGDGTSNAAAAAGAGVVIVPK